MIINIHAGHNPAGLIGCGAVGLINESIEDRRVKDEAVRQLRLLGHTVYDCTVNNGTSQSDILKKIVEKCNKNSVDVDVSIHFNSGAKDEKGNGKTTGTEVYVYSDSSKAKTYAEKIVTEISNLGFKNRGVKTSKNLYVLKNTKSPALLIECCFVDDADDAALYNYKDVASAIVKGLTGQVLNETSASSKDTSSKEGAVYRVQVGAFSNKSNAEKLKNELENKGYSAIVVEG